MTSLERINVAIVDDHSLFRAGVIQSLTLDPAISVVGEGASGKEALNLATTHAPDVLLLDISMPGDGIDTAERIAGLPRAPKVVMLTVSEEDDDVIRALEAGAIGYILKGINARELIGAVKSIAAGNSFVSPNLTRRLLDGMKRKSEKSPISTLTRQEERTLRLVAVGLSNRDIAGRLGVHEKTIKYHMTNILAKLKVKNRVEAALAAREEWGPEGALDAGLR